MKAKLRDSETSTAEPDTNHRNRPEVEIADDRLQFHWRHLATVAIVTGVAQGIVFCVIVFFFAARLQNECRAVAKAEAERILWGKVTVSRAPESNVVESRPRALRMRRASNDRNPGNGSAPKPSRRNHQRNQRTRRIVEQNDFSNLAIHLEFSVPQLEQSVIARLNRDNRSSEAVEFGNVYSQRRFKPYPDRSNGTVRYSIRNWVPSKWFNSTSDSASAVFQYEYNRGTVHVRRSGLYYVYSQIRMYHNRPFSYGVMINDDRILLKCVEGADDVRPLPQFSSCRLGGVAELRAGDRLWLRDMYDRLSGLYDNYIHLDPALGASSYWGVVRLGPQDT